MKKFLFALPLMLAFTFASAADNGGAKPAEKDPKIVLTPAQREAFKAKRAKQVQERAVRNAETAKQESDVKALVAKYNADKTDANKKAVEDYIGSVWDKRQAEDQERIAKAKANPNIDQKRLSALEAMLQKRNTPENKAKFVQDSVKRALAGEQVFTRETMMRNYDKAQQDAAPDKDVKDAGGAAPAK